MQKTYLTDQRTKSLIKNKTEIIAIVFLQESYNSLWKNKIRWHYSTETLFI